MHSFRHSMRDRLRAVECPSDIIDQLGGSATERVGQGYGQRISVKALLQMVENAITWFRKYYAVIQNLSALNLRGRSLCQS